MRREDFYWTAMVARLLGRHRSNACEAPRCHAKHPEATGFSGPGEGCCAPVRPSGRKHCARRARMEPNGCILATAGEQKANSGSYGFLILRCSQ